MKMYIANCTQQVQDFTYRLPEGKSVRSQRIEIGGHTRISGELSQPDIDAIVAHHGRYGLVSAEDAGRTKNFVGMFYTVDRVPQIGRIHEMIAHNVVVLRERGQRIRQEAAIATSAAIERESPPGSLAALEMSVVEERRDGRDVTDPEIAEGVRVDRAHGGPPAPTEKGRGRRRAAA